MNIVCFSIRLGLLLFLHQNFIEFFCIQMVQRLKRLPTMQEAWVRFLGREDPLEKEMATHSNILAWRIPRMGEHGGLQSTVPGASVRNPTRDNVTQQRSDGQG